MAKQLPVFRGIAVDAASGLIDDRLVLEVRSQRIVVCGKGARAADDGQSQHVAIVGRADLNGTKPSFLMPESFRVGGSQASCPVERNELPSHVVVLCKFFSKFARRDESGRAAVPKEPVDDRAGLHEEFWSDVCVNNEAHVRYPEGRVLL